MSVRAQLDLSAVFTETVEPATAHGLPVPVRHALPSGRITKMFDNIWSQNVDVPMGPPVTLDMSILPLVNSGNTRDLFTDQEIGWFSLEHDDQAGTGTATLYRGEDVMVSKVISRNKLLIETGVDGHLFGQPIDKIEFMALTGGFTVNVIVATPNA